MCPSEFDLQHEVMPADVAAPGCSNSTGDNCSTATSHDGGGGGGGGAACDTTQYELSWHLQLVYVAAFVFIVVVATGGNAIVVWVVLACRA